MEGSIEISKGRDLLLEHVSETKQFQECSKDTIAPERPSPLPKCNLIETIFALKRGTLGV